MFGFGFNGSLGSSPQPTGRPTFDFTSIQKILNSGILKPKLQQPAPMPDATGNAGQSGQAPAPDLMGINGQGLGPDIKAKSLGIGDLLKKTLLGGLGL
jgi:hypothetical protein